MFEAEALRDNALNRRELLEEQRIHRGRIRARDGTVLARSVEAPTRRTRAATRGRAVRARRRLLVHSTSAAPGLERSRNDELTGERDDVGSIIDQLAGTEREGDDVRTTLDPTRSALASRRSAAARGAVVALEPAHRRASGDGDHTRLRPERAARARGAQELNRAEGAPLLNRTTRAATRRARRSRSSPRSAAIDSGKFTQDSTVDGSQPQDDLRRAAEQLRRRGLRADPADDRADELGQHGVGARSASSSAARRCSSYMERFGFYDAASRSTCRADERRAAACYVARRRRLVPTTDDAVDVGRIAIGQDELLVDAAADGDGRRRRSPTTASSDATALTDRVVDRDGRSRADRAGRACPR